MLIKKGRGELLGIAKIALVASVLMIALTPLANAAIIEFTITPDTVWSCEETTIIVEVKSNTSWHWQNTTIPAGFCVEMPTTGGVQIVRTDFWDDSGYVGNVTIKSNMANPSSQVDVTVMINSDEVTFTEDITYAPGGTFTINSPFGGGSMLEVRWPTETEEGYANVSVPGVPLKDITDVYTLRICCPQSCETYTFFATAEGDPVGKSDSLVVCSVPVPVYNTLGVAALIGIMSVVLGFATMRRKR